MTFEYEFTKKEEAALKRFKKRYPTGPYTFSFCNVGIGMVVHVLDEYSQKQADLTDYGSW